MWPCLMPNFYFELGEMALRCLFEFWVRNPTILLSSNSIEWTGVKKYRADLIKMCDFRGLADDEKVLRCLAFSGFEEHFIYDD